MKKYGFFVKNILIDWPYYPVLELNKPTFNNKTIKYNWIERDYLPKMFGSQGWESWSMIHSMQICSILNHNILIFTINILLMSKYRVADRTRQLSHNFKIVYNLNSCLICCITDLWFISPMLFLKKWQIIIERFWQKNYLILCK